jgi:hypothetical protein
MFQLYQYVYVQCCRKDSDSGILYIANMYKKAFNLQLTRDEFDVCLHSVSMLNTSLSMIGYEGKGSVYGA